MSLERTHCTRGHRLTEANTYFQRQSSNGNIVALCKTCKRARDKGKRERLREQRAAAHARNQRDARARGLPPGAPQHGTANGATYYGCKCQPCRDAYNEAARLRRLKAKARAAGVDVDAVLAPANRAQVYAIGGFEDRGDSRSRWEDPVLDEVLERVG